MKRENLHMAECLGKKRYETFQSAQRSARTVKPYHCTYCNGFHNGSTIGKAYGRRPVPELSEEDRAEMEGRN